MKSPCQGCEARYLGCHSQCPLYAEFRAECDRRYQAGVQDRLIDVHNARFHRGWAQYQRRVKNARQLRP